MSERRYSNRKTLKIEQHDIASLDQLRETRFSASTSSYAGQRETFILGL